MRKCPHAADMLGYNSLWDMKTTQFNWILDNLSEEFKEPEEKSIDKLADKHGRR